MTTPFLKAVSLSKSYDTDPLFQNVDFTIGPGDRIGLVGPNGVGKSTLLRCTTGEEHPTTGRIDLAPGTELGFFAQQVPDPDAHVGDFLAEGLGEIHHLDIQLRTLAAQIADGSAAALAEYGDVQDRWTAQQGWLAEARLQEVRQRLNIAHLADSTPLAQVSGGEQARLMLGRLLLRRPGILILDEPTNHLDATGTAWLASYLADFPGGVLMVTHDRAFLDRVATRIFELDGLSPELATYEGGYTDYRREKAHRWANLLLDYEAQEKQRRRLQADIDATKHQSLSTELATRNDHWRRIAKKVAKKAKARQKRLERQMQALTWIAQPETRPKLSLEFPGQATTGQTVLSAKAINIRLGDRTLLADVDLDIRGGDRILVTGDNGAGKTTLLRILSGALEPDSGTVLTEHDIAVLPQSHDQLRTKQTTMDYFRSQVPLYPEDAEQLLSAYMFGPDDWQTPLADLSAGELRRLLLAVIVNAPARVLMLDEPTNYLDFDSLDVIEEALREFGGTLVMVTHDTYFADRVGFTRTWEVRDGTITETTTTTNPAAQP